MNTQESYKKAKDLGYSDEEIMDYLSKKDPNFSKKIEKAQSYGYSPEEVISHFNNPKESKEPDFFDYGKEFTQQFAEGTGIGALGTYGDILDFFGLQAKEKLPGQEEKESKEIATLNKLKEGKVPSISELEELSEEPLFYRFPTSENIEKIGKMTGLVSEPETFAGRYGKRIGKLGGSAVSLGAGSLTTPIVAGVAGQTLEELGAPPWAQAAAEIISTIKLSPKTATNITSKSPEVEKTIKNLRKAGYSEQDITLAKNALEERKILKKYSSMNPEAENAIQTGIKNSENLIKDQIKKGLPGYSEGGIPYLEKQASNVYQTMEDLASTIPIKNSEPVRKSIENSIAYLEKYPLLKEQKEFIEFLKEGLEKSKNANTAEFFTGFYRNLGRAGNWGNPKQKEHILGIVKQGIKDTFEHSGPEAKKFGQYFEKTNEAWKKWIDSKDLMNTIEKAQMTDGMNFKKLTSILEDKENFELAQKVLGTEQVQNIRSINEGAKAIESLLKQIPKNNKDIQSLKFLEGIRSVLTGDYRPLAALIGMEAAKRLSTNLLINPEKQNIMKKIIIAAKNQSPRSAAILARELIKEDSFQSTKEK